MLATKLYPSSLYNTSKRNFAKQTGEKHKEKRGKRENRLPRFFHIYIITAILAAFIAFPNAVKSYNGTCLFMTNALLYETTLLT